MPSDHFDGARFFNPGHPPTDRSLRALLRWRFNGARAAWPARVPVTPVVPAARCDGLVVTMVGHSSLLVQAGGVNVLTDPVWSERASPVGFAGPKRAAAPGIRFEDLPPIDAVLLSHNHYDHMDVATLRRLQAAHAPLMVMPLGNDAIVGKAVPGARMAVADWGGTVALPGGAEAVLTPAQHWSARGLGDRRKALWCGFYLRLPGARVWYAGDTGYGDGAIFRAVQVGLGAPDAALIPIGAYEPRWFMRAQHCDPAEAVRIFQDVGAVRALGIHWGTFQLTDEARDEPPRLLGEALAAAGIAAGRFVAAAPGGAFVASGDGWAR